MHKFAALFLALAMLPSMALAHATNDLSSGLIHWLFSPNHLPAFIGMGVILAGFIWWVTRPDDKDAKERVRERS